MHMIFISPTFYKNKIKNVNDNTVKSVSRNTVVVFFRQW